MYACNYKMSIKQLSFWRMWKFYWLIRVVRSLQTHELAQVRICRKFPSGLVVRSRPFYWWGPGSIPGPETKILQAERCDKQTNKKSISLKTVMFLCHYYRVVYKRKKGQKWWVKKIPTVSSDWRKRKTKNPKAIRRIMPD